MARLLSCPTGCGGRRFEALNAPVYVDATGRYLDHEASRAAYVCAECGSVAVDLAEAMREAERAQAVDRVQDRETVVCPGCGTEMLPPEDDPDADLMECPVCEMRFSLDEGRVRLFGGGIHDLDLDEVDRPDRTARDRN